MSLTFGLFTQVSGSGPLGPLVFFSFGNCDLAMRHDSVTFQMGYHMIHFLVFSGKVLHLAHYKD